MLQKMLTDVATFGRINFENKAFSLRCEDADQQARREDAECPDKICRKAGIAANAVVEAQLLSSSPDDDNLGQ